MFRCVTIKFMNASQIARLLLSLTAGFVLSIGLAPLANAQDTSAVAIALAAKLVLTGEDGKETSVVADKALPGQTMEYSAICKNGSPSAVTNLQPVIPVPEGTEYILESAKPAPVSASTDGVVFSPLPLQKAVKQADGSVKQEPLPAREYRAIRWSVSELRPDAVSIVSLRVRVATNPVPATTPAKK